MAIQVQYYDLHRLSHGRIILLKTLSYCCK